MNLSKSVLGLAAATAAFGCVTRSDIDELKTNQQEIISKIEQLEKAAPAARPAPPAPQRPDPRLVYSVDVGEAHTKGPDDAWVTIIEISDFQCPFCSRALPTLDQVRELYGDDVRLVWKHNPLGFHRNAMPSALASECVGEQSQEKFWEYHDKLFANQRALASTDLENYAKDVGVNLPQWKKCVAENKYQKKIDADRTAAMSVGAGGTPTFFVNGRYVRGAQPFPVFKQIIDEELEKAKKSGIAKGEYYAKAIVAKGKKKL